MLARWCLLLRRSYRLPSSDVKVARIRWVMSVWCSPWGKNTEMKLSKICTRKELWSFGDISCRDVCLLQNIMEQTALGLWKPTNLDCEIATKNVFLMNVDVFQIYFKKHKDKICNGQINTAEPDNLRVAGGDQTRAQKEKQSLLLSLHWNFGTFLFLC